MVVINGKTNIVGVWDDTDGRYWILDNSNIYFPNCVILTDNVVHDSDPDIGYEAWYREVLFDRVALHYEANQIIINGKKF